MGGFWREVFDLSERAETPARMKATVQVGLTVGILGLVLILVTGVVTAWSNPILINLLVLPVIGFALAGGSTIDSAKTDNVGQDDGGSGTTDQPEPRISLA